MIGFQICTGNDREDRDPITVTIEGSDVVRIKLPLGSSWNLISNGSAGLSTNPGRYRWETAQYLLNTNQYSNYRFLTSNKRVAGNSVEYSEVQFFGN